MKLILIISFLFLVSCRGMVVIEMQPGNYSIEITAPTESGYGFGIYSAEETTPAEVTETAKNNCTPIYSIHSCVVID